MHIITQYLNSLSKDDRAAFVLRCDTSEGYLRKAASIKQNLGIALCVALERESNGALRCEGLRDDVDWAYLRQPAKHEAKEVNHA